MFSLSTIGLLNRVFGLLGLKREEKHLMALNQQREWNTPV